MTARNSYLLRKYGITEASYNKVLQNQGGCCGCCRRPATVFRRSLAVDHDHQSGEIRGLLCIYCNRYVIGRHRAPDGYQLLLNAAKYLKGPYTGWFVPVKKKKKRKARK